MHLNNNAWDGKEKVAQIITFGKLQARAVIRDVGRVLGMPYGQVDGLCKLMPFDPSRPMSLQGYIDSLFQGDHCSALN